MSDVAVRLALPSDVPFVEACEQKYIDCPWTAEQIREEIGSPCALFLIAESDGRAVGYLSGRTAANECEIANIAVSEEYRRRGVGRALFCEFILRMKNKNVTELFLLVRDGNNAAIGLYESMGFSVVGRRKKYYGESDALIMRLIV